MIWLIDPIAGVGITLRNYGRRRVVHGFCCPVPVFQLYGRPFSNLRFATLPPFLNDPGATDCERAVIARLNIASAAGCVHTQCLTVTKLGSMKRWYRGHSAAHQQIIEQISTASSKRLTLLSSFPLLQHRQRCEVLKVKNDLGRVPERIVRCLSGLDGFAIPTYPNIESEEC